MKRLFWSAALIAGFMATAQASATGPDDANQAGLDPVDKIHLAETINSWSLIDNDTLIVWASPSRPYLVELSRPSYDLRFAEEIGITSTVGNIEQKFDSVVVDGIPYQIRAIYKLDRKTARQMKRKS